MQRHRSLTLLGTGPSLYSESELQMFLQGKSCLWLSVSRCKEVMVVGNHLTDLRRPAKKLPLFVSFLSIPEKFTNRCIYRNYLKRRKLIRVQTRPPLPDPCSNLPTIEIIFIAHCLQLVTYLRVRIGELNQSSEKHHQCDSQAEVRQ